MDHIAVWALQNPVCFCFERQFIAEEYMEQSLELNYICIHKYLYLGCSKFYNHK